MRTRAGPLPRAAAEILLVPLQDQTIRALGRSLLCWRCSVPLTAADQARGECACPACIARAPEAHRREFWSYVEHMDELGMAPSEARRDLRWRLVQLRSVCLTDSALYDVELFGLSMPYQEATPDWPCWAIDRDDGQPGVLVQLWEQIVRPKGTGIPGRRLWHPKQGYAPLSFSDWAPPFFFEELVPAGRGLDALARLVKRGRPPGVTLWPLEVFKPRFEQTWREVLEGGESEPGELTVFNSMPSIGDPLSLSTFRRRYQEGYHVKGWEDLHF